MKYTIYLRTNLVNGKQYVGQTSNFKRREYQWKCIKLTYANKFIDEDRLKYGFENWKTEILAEVDKQEDAWELERRFIKDFNTKHPNGYNLSDGGAGVCGVKFPDELKKRFSNERKGKKVTEEHRAKIIKGLRGRKHSEETKKKISEAHKGMKASEKTKQKLREIKRKNNPFKKPVAQLTKDDILLKIFDSAADAERELGILAQNISRCCKGRTNSAGGFKWNYYIIDTALTKSLSLDSCCT